MITLILSICFFVSVLLFAFLRKSGALYVVQDGITPIMSGRSIVNFFDSDRGSILPFRIAGIPFLKQAGTLLDSQIEISINVPDVEVGRGITGEDSRMNFDVRVAVKLNTSDVTPREFVDFLRRFFVRNENGTAVLKTTKEAIEREVTAAVKAEVTRQMVQLPTSIVEAMTDIQTDTLNNRLFQKQLYVSVTLFEIDDKNPTNDDKARRNAQIEREIAEHQADAQKVRDEQQLEIERKKAKIRVDEEQGMLSARTAHIKDVRDAAGETAAALAAVPNLQVLGSGATAAINLNQKEKRRRGRNNNQGGS